MEFRRKLYTRGSSYETTIPKPLLFALDLEKKQEVRFIYDAEKGRWYLGFEERELPSGERSTLDSAEEREGGER